MHFGQKVCKGHCQIHVPFTGEVYQKVVRDIIWILGLLCTYIIIFSYFFFPLHLILFLIFLPGLKWGWFLPNWKCHPLCTLLLNFKDFITVFIKEYVIMKMWRIQIISSLKSPGVDCDFGNFTLGSAVSSPKEGTWMISDARWSVNNGNWLGDDHLSKTGKVSVNLWSQVVFLRVWYWGQY